MKLIGGQKQIALANVQNQRIAKPFGYQYVNDTNVVDILKLTQVHAIPMYWLVL
jgi:hypothetical protein